MNGKIIIGTEVDTTGLDEGVKKIEKKDTDSKINVKVNSDFDKDFERLWEKMTGEIDKPHEVKIETNNIDKTVDDISKVEQQLNELEGQHLNYSFVQDLGLEEAKLKLEEINKEKNAILNNPKNIYNGELITSQEDTDKLLELIDLSTELENRIKSIQAIPTKPLEIISDSELEEMQYKLQSLVSEYESLKSAKITDDLDTEHLASLREKIDEVRASIEKTTGSKISIKGIDKSADGVDKLNKKLKASTGFEKLYKGAKKLTMGIIGVRAAYGLVRKMASSYLEDNENTAANLKNLWTGLGVLMGGIIEGIVALLRKAVTAILYFASVLTGVNYIQKANAAILKKQTKATKGLRKEQEKLTASFDEMEVLQDNSSSSNDASSGGVNGDLFNVEELGAAKEIIEKIAKALKPVWEIMKKIVQWAIEHPDALLVILGGMLLLKTIGRILGFAGAAGAGGSGLLGILAALTAIAAIGTIYLTIKGLKELQDYNKEIREINENTVNLNKQLNEERRERDLTAEEVAKHTQELTSNNQLLKEQIESTYKSKRESSALQKIIDGLAGTWQTNNDYMKGNIQMMFENFKSMQKLYEQGKLNEEQTSQYKDMLLMLNEVLDASTYGTENMASALGLTAEQEKEFEQMTKYVKDAMKEMGIESYTASDSVGKVASAIIGSKKGIADTITELVGIKDAMIGLKKNDTVTMKVDADTHKAQSKLATFFNSFSSKIMSNFGFASGGLIVPQLASGGIINRPGRGVPLGNAIGGEAGKEGVIPLTDSQAMAQLGYEIGKNITLNNTIPVYVGNRQVAKEIRRINAEDNFASNR